MADADFYNPTKESIWKVTRQLKKEQLSLYNCVASVLSDAAFVSEVRALYPGIPLLANLRCGLWYTRQADGTCYFKSTDGHNGNWSFSSTRLNWHVCELAAKHGGAIIVDATRKGKRFPDAMTKTIPIWTAVINRAVARKRAEAAEKQASEVHALAEAAAAHAVANSADAAPPGPEQQQPSCYAEGAPSINTATPACITSESPAETSSCAPAGTCSPPPRVLATPSSAADRLRIQVCGGGRRYGRASGLPCPCSPSAGSPAGSEPESCARVGSLSQWLHSPGGLSEWEEAPRVDSVRSGSSRRLAATSSLALSSNLEADAYNDSLGSGDAQDREREEETFVTAGAEAASPGLPSGGLDAPSMGTDATDSTCSPHDDGYGCRRCATAAATAVAMGQADDLERPQEHQQPPPSDGDLPVLAGSEGFLNADRVQGQAQQQQSSVSHTAALETDPEGEAEVEADADTEGCGAPLCAGDRQRSRRPSSCSSSSASSSRCASRASSCCSDQADGDSGVGLMSASGSSNDLSRPSSALDSETPLLWDGGSNNVQGGCGVGAGSNGDGGSISNAEPVQQAASVFALYSSGCCGNNNVEDTCCGACAHGDCCSNVSCAHCLSPPLSFTFTPDLYGSSPSPNSSHCSGDLSYGAQHLECQQHEHVPLVTGQGQSQGLSLGPCFCGKWGGFATCISLCRPSEVNSEAGYPAAALDELEERPQGNGWDTELHLPLWISANERAQIERRLDGWVDALLRVGADVEGLAKVLRKPLRPLWISQASTIWVDQVTQPDQLPFTPLYLVSASQPHSYVRQTTSVCTRAGGDASGTSSDSDADANPDGEAGVAEGSAGQGCRLQRTRRRGPGSRYAQKRADRPTTPRHEQARRHQEQQHAWTYVYVPGAGDDEESWAAGLTPAVFWAHANRLLQAGPASVHDVVQQLLHEEAATLAETGTNSTIVGTGSLPCSSQPATDTLGDLERRGVGPKAEAAATIPYIAATDEHHLLPAGCRAGGAGALVPGPCGMYFLGPTGIALGDLAAGAAPDVWKHVDAVLSVGTTRHPSMAGEPEWPAHAGAGGAVSAAEVVACAKMSAVPHGGCVGLAAPAAESNDTVDLLAIGTPACGAQTARHYNSHNHHHAARYLHLPIDHSKHNRNSLAEQLETALRFLSHHLSRRHRVLVHDTNGLDTCVCVVVALLLSCYGPCSANGNGGSESGPNGAGNGGDGNTPQWVQPYHCSGGGLGLGVGQVSKDAVRQRLAFVSACYPPARPTRGMLRQVFNHFAQERGTGGGAQPWLPSADMVGKPESSQGETTE